MSRLFLILGSCLLLVCCDKQGSSKVSNASPASPTQSPRRSLTARDATVDNPRHLRDLMDQAETLDPVEREKTLAAIVWTAMELDPKIAHEAFVKMAPGSSEKIRLIQHYANSMAAQNIEEAIIWATEFINETEKSAALCQIAVSLAETDPEQAADILTESEIPGRDFDVAVVQVIQRWAAQDPAEVSAWVSMFPQSPAREAGIKIIAERWLPVDAPAALAWLESLQDTTLRQETARAMEGVILQQTAGTRTAWLQHADAQLQAELEQQRDAALKDVGDNIRPEE